MAPWKNVSAGVQLESKPVTAAFVVSGGAWVPAEHRAKPLWLSRVVPVVSLQMIFLLSRDTGDNIQFSIHAGTTPPTVQIGTPIRIFLLLPSKVGRIAHLIRGLGNPKTLVD